MSAPMLRLGRASSAAMGRKARSSAVRQSSKKRRQREGAGRFGRSGDGGEGIDRIVTTFLLFYSSSAVSFRLSSGGNSVRVSSESTLTRGWQSGGKRSLAFSTEVRVSGRTKY